MRTPPNKDGFVCLGFIAGAHGIKGELRLKSDTANPTDIGAYGQLLCEDGRTISISKARLGPRNSVLAKCENIPDRTAAETYQGQYLYIARSALPASDAPYYADLYHMPVVDSHGQPCGRVVNTFHNGAHDVVEIEDNGALTLIPYASQFMELKDKTLQLTGEGEGFFNLPD
ncbi:MAG: ribosome maturation factor RimM [Alphaproteobacteria bacterium]